MIMGGRKVEEKDLPSISSLETIKEYQKNPDLRMVSYASSK